MHTWWSWAELGQGTSATPGPALSPCIQGQPLVTAPWPGHGAAAAPLGQTMVSKSALALVVLLLFHFPRPVVNGFDEDAQQSEEDVEQATPEPPEPGWGPLHMAAMQQGPFWVAAELLFLSLLFWFRRRRVAMKQRVAAQRAEEEARRRKMEIKQRRLRFKRRYNDLKEMWRTMKTVKKKIARLF